MEVMMWKEIDTTHNMCFFFLCLLFGLGLFGVCVVVGGPFWGECDSFIRVNGQQV